MAANLAVNLICEQDSERSCNQEEPGKPDGVDPKGVPKDWGVEEDVFVVSKPCPLNVLWIDSGPVGE